MSERNYDEYKDISIQDLLNDFDNMCNYHVTCSCCELDSYNGCLFDKANLLKVIDIVINWKNNHPKVKRKDLFMQLFPDSVPDDLCPIKAFHKFRDLNCDDFKKYHQEEEDAGSDQSTICNVCRNNYWNYLRGLMK